MSAHFKAFLDRTYINPEPITTILNRFDWYNLLSTRIDHIIEQSAPNYSLVVSSLIQSINDQLRTHSDRVEKTAIVEDLGKLFRNLLAYLCEFKIGFSNQLPEIIQNIKTLYEINGDNFDELDELLDFNRFVTNVETAISRSYITSFLKWCHNSASLEDLSDCLIKYGLITSDSKIEDLFSEVEIKYVKVPKQALKRFTLVMSKLFQDKIIKPVGGKSTFEFIEKHVLIENKGQLIPFKKEYMKKTVYATNKSWVGYGKHSDTINDFMDEINEKNRLYASSTIKSTGT